VSSCRACGAPIRWAITRNGKRIPLDAAPNPAGNVSLHEAGSGMAFATVHAGPPGMLDDWEAWMPHHATCPNWARR
jgi:hypothetical protein